DLGVTGRGNAALVVDQGLHRHLAPEQGGQDRSCGRADKDLGLAGIPAVGVLHRGERADHPRGAENTSATEDDGAPRAAHRTDSTSSASDSWMHWARTSTSGIASRSTF